MKKVFFTGIGVIAAVLLLTTPDASRAAAPLPILGFAAAKSAATTKTAVAGATTATGVAAARAARAKRAERYDKYIRNVKAGQKNRVTKEVQDWDGKTMRKNNRAGR